MRLRRHATTLAVAVVCVAVAAALPALAHGVEHALFAHDAGQVDGFDATGAGASAAARAGKLVATDQQGRLPNNIILKAPDADRFDGIESAKFRSLSLDMHAAHISGGGAIRPGGVTTVSGVHSQFSVGFMAPPDRQAGSPLFLDLVLEETSAEACTAVVYVGSTFGPTSDGTTADGQWTLVSPESAASGVTTLPAGSRTVFPRTWRFNRPNGLGPGDFLYFYIVRDAEFDDRDTCGTVGFIGARVRY